MNRLLTPILALLLLAVGLAGCANSSEIIARGLRIELTGLNRAADGTVDVSWRVQNPNISPYLLSRVTNKIYLNGTLVGTTVDNQPMAVPAQAVTDRNSKLIGNAAGDRALADAITQGTASYKVDTQIVISIYDDTIEKSALTNSGTVPVAAK